MTTYTCIHAILLSAGAQRLRKPRKSVEFGLAVFPKRPRDTPGANDLGPFARNLVDLSSFRSRAQYGVTFTSSLYEPSDGPEEISCRRSPRYVTSCQLFGTSFVYTGMFWPGGKVKKQDRAKNFNAEFARRRMYLFIEIFPFPLFTWKTNRELVVLK